MSNKTIFAEAVFLAKSSLDKVISLLDDVLFHLKEGFIELRDNICVKYAIRVYESLKAKYSSQKLHLLRQEPLTIILFAEAEIMMILAEVENFFIFKKYVK